jgi:hypothetical protein
MIQFNGTIAGPEKRRFLLHSRKLSLDIFIHLFFAVEVRTLELSTATLCRLWQNTPGVMLESRIFHCSTS